MTAFDTDVLGLALLGKVPDAALASSIPIHERGIPIVVAEELLRGRLDQVRKAESGKAKLSLPEAYAFLDSTLTGLRGGVYLPFTDDAANLVASWRAARIRVKVMDMRIAAIAIDKGATLVTRNVRDFNLVPGLKLDVWT
jgi:tRNA(fMet)-specific endonuclease VapC